MKFTENTLKRALRTFLQAALSYFLVNLAASDFYRGDTALKSLLIGLAASSLAAGISAVMNLEGGDNNDLYSVH